MQNSRYSPDQSPSDKLVQVGEKEPSPQIAEWKLEVRGLVKNALTFSLSEFQNLPTREETWDTICVTGWTHLDDCWRGVALQDILQKAQPLPQARYVRFVAYSLRDHDTSLPLDYALSHVLLASGLNGSPLSREHGGPVRSVCNGKYFYKSLKWLKTIELLAQDQLGYWENVSSYHNNADPWKNERFVPRLIPAAEFQERCASRDFSDTVAVRDDQFATLKDLDLSGGNFARAQIKGCSLHEARMAGADLSGANFTLCKFSNADLRGALLLNCDLEGADLRGADLTGADLRGASLTATKFVRQHFPAKIRGARFLRAGIETPGVNQREREFLLDSKQGALIE
jgi:hypothetical protein